MTAYYVVESKPKKEVAQPPRVPQTPKTGGGGNGILILIVLALLATAAWIYSKTQAVGTATPAVTTTALPITGEQWTEIKTILGGNLKEIGGHLIESDLDKLARLLGPTILSVEEFAWMLSKIESLPSGKLKSLIVDRICEIAPTLSMCSKVAQELPASDPDCDVLNTRKSDLNINTRAESFLPYENGKTHTLRDILNFTPRQVLKGRNFGPKTLRLLREDLKKIIDKNPCLQGKSYPIFEEDF